MSTAITEQVQVHDADNVRWITLDRPASRNGLTMDVVERLIELFDDAATNSDVRVLVLHGANGAFCSGLDLKAAASLALGGGSTDTSFGMKRFHDLVRALQNIAKPTIASVDGAAAGFGCDLALGCDLRIGSARARLGERFVRIGLMPDGGGTYFLPRLVGRAKALELIYEGRMVESEEAVQLGLLNKLFDSEGFEAAVQTYAAGLAKGPPLSYAASKRAVLGADGTLETSLRLEAEGQLQLLNTADFMEGVQAFLTKRPPNFIGQ